MPAARTGVRGDDRLARRRLRRCDGLLLGAFPVLAVFTALAQFVERGTATGLDASCARTAATRVFDTRP